MEIGKVIFWMIALKLLQCKGCLDTYTLVGAFKRPVSSYSFDQSSPLSLSQCESLCNNNIGCMGYYHNSLDRSCELSSSYFYNTDIFCPSCTFYIRHCQIGCFNNYTVIGPYAQGEGVLYEATVSEGKCKSLCTANASCQGFHHDIHTDLCQLTVGYSAVPSFSSGSFFHMRHCPKACSYTYKFLGPNAKSLAVFWENTSTQSECQDECSAHSFCMGFYYRTDNSLCQLSTNNMNGGFTFCIACNFYQRECFVTTIGTVSAVTGSSSDIFGISSLIIPETTTETPVSESVQNTSPDSHTPSKQTTEEVTLSETHETPTLTTAAVQSSSSDIPTTEPTAQTSYEPTPINSPMSNNSFAQCSCSCKKTNVSLEESIERRKNELQVNVKELSSTKRKLISVDDSRPSAQALGQVGVVILAFIGSSIVLPDVISVFIFCYAHFKH